MSFTLVYFVAFFMLAIAAGFLVFVRRKTGTFFPNDVAERMGSLLSMVLIVSAGLLAFVTYRVDSGRGFNVPGGPSLSREEINSPAPDFAFTMVNSQERSTLSNYEGDVVLINFWATWCAPCLVELPDLNQLQEKYRSKGLTVLTISDESRETLTDFGITLPLTTTSGYIADPDSIPDPFRRTLAVRPTSYVIDREGIIREFVLGARDLRTFERMIAPYLNDVVAESSL
ncbi:MAG: TlpA disulfide reductase family protein [Rhodothermales bacterium]